MRRLNEMWTAVTLAAGLAMGVSAPVWAHEDGEEGGHLIPHHVDGLSVEGGMTWYLQGTDGLKKGAQPGDAADLTYTLDLGVSARVTEGTSLNVAFEAGDGNGVNGRLGSLSTANYDAFITEVSAGQNFPNLSQAYLESKFADGGVVLEFGKLDIHSHYDDNAFANDETAQFLSGIFTRSAGTSYGELDGYYAPGVALTVAAGSHLTLHGVLANGNGSGFDGVSDRPYAAAQVTLNHCGGEWSEGNVRLYGIRDARRYLDLNGRQTENIAWGVSVDQALGPVGLFGRYSAQKDDIQLINKWDAATATYSIVEPANLVKGAWSGGVQLGGALWGREADAVGIGYGVVQANGKNPEWVATAGIANPDDETHLEVYYSLAVSDHLAFTADVQQIGSNGGDPAADAIRIYGVRGQINF
ncbi:MAG: carbohydrate porin [Nitrospirota bacterium]|nr:carbohydrate porin [Nitrospirota bacterium]